MITGDNIYIAVETARRAGIINPDQKVVFLEGNRNMA
jgi:magnesium-transporting ATPase (P-type)